MLLECESWQVRNLTKQQHLIISCFPNESNFCAAAVGEAFNGQKRKIICVWGLFCSLYSIFTIKFLVIILWKTDKIKQNKLIQMNKNWDGSQVSKICLIICKIHYQQNRFSSKLEFWHQPFWVNFVESAPAKQRIIFLWWNPITVQLTCDPGCWPSGK